MSITRIKGFADLFPPVSTLYTKMEACARRVFSACGFIELRTPLVEYTELFQRSIGAETDVVQKEMYTFADRKGRSLTLRPEATAGVMRAFIASELANNHQVSKLFTCGPMFRYERPQKGRMRQFHQINCECLGSASPYADADMIVMLLRFLKELGLKDLVLHLNSLGCSQCRPHFNTALRTFLHSLDSSQLCADCVRRIDTNPLRVLDCKQATCQALTENAPRLQDYLCSECQTHFTTVKNLLATAKITYLLDHRLVRGLDYYCKTTFEVTSGGIGSQSAVAGGGRYDGLISALGGADVPGIGFACGMERLALLLPDQPDKRLDFYLAVLEAELLPLGFSLVQQFREQGLAGEMSLVPAGLKNLLRQADKSGVRFCLLLGSDENAKQVLTLKNMTTSQQLTLPFAEVVNYLRTC